MEGATSLSQRALGLVQQAELLIGGERLLAMFPQVQALRVAIKNDLTPVLKAIKENLESKKIRVLASGDPGFFGIARYLVENLGKDKLEIVPNVSSMQLAFARIKESWEDAVFLSAHARPLENILDIARKSSKICLFTDGWNTPDAIGKFLLERGLTGFHAFVCEEMGGEGEKVFQGSLEQLSQEKFSPLNVLVLMKTSTQRIQNAEERIQEPEGRIGGCFQGPGIPDEEFYQVKGERGLITKMEIRVVSLAKMQVRENDIVWDIGAGSGSISIEAAFLARRGKVYAIEKEESRLEIIKQNIKKFSAGNVVTVRANAPGGMESLPGPDAVFIGGSGGKISEILDFCCQRIKKGGRIVANIATLENLGTTVKNLEEKGLSTDVVLLNAARGSKIKDLHRMESLNPVFIVSATRKSK